MVALTLACGVVGFYLFCAGLCIITTFVFILLTCARPPQFHHLQSLRIQDLRPGDILLCHMHNDSWQKRLSTLSHVLICYRESDNGEVMTFECRGPRALHNRAEFLVRPLCEAVEQLRIVSDVFARRLIKPLSRLEEAALTREVHEIRSDPRSTYAQYPILSYMASLVTLQGLMPTWLLEAQKEHTCATLVAYLLRRRLALTQRQQRFVLPAMLGSQWSPFARLLAHGQLAEAWSSECDIN